MSESIGGTGGTAAAAFLSCKFIILNTKFLVFDTQFLVCNTKFLVLNAKLIICTHRRVCNSCQMKEGRVPVSDVDDAIVGRSCHSRR